MPSSDKSEMGNAPDQSVKTPVKILRETPLKYQSNDHINNLQEEKENFLKFGKVPRFTFAGAVDWLGINKKKAEIRFDFFSRSALHSRTRARCLWQWGCVSGRGIWREDFAWSSIADSLTVFKIAWFGWFAKRFLDKRSQLQWKDVMAGT